MPADRTAIVAFCQRYLKVKEFKDGCVNGLQVEGTPLIGRIVTGVSWSKQLTQAAIDRTAQMIIVHHGIFENQFSHPPVVEGIVRRRLKPLLQHDINLCGFHLPLDAHPVIGNNASLCRLLGVGRLKPFEVGYIGELPRPVAFKTLRAAVDKRLGVKSFVIDAGPKKVRRVAIISGGASPDFEQAARLGADVFLCGDVREEVVRAVEEAGIHFINAGHYNTEKLGIQNLGKLIRRRFKIPVDFVDIPCEV
jgi:dinuclear metal center YbgI/SA1388 family protein